MTDNARGRAVIFTGAVAVAAVALAACSTASPRRHRVRHLPGGSTVTPVDLTTGRAGRAITLGSGLLGGSGGAVCGFAIAPDGATGYVLGCGGLDTDTLVPLSLPSGTPGHPISVDVSATRGSFQDIAIAPDGTTAYVSRVGGSGGVVSKVTRLAATRG